MSRVLVVLISAVLAGCQCTPRGTPDDAGNAEDRDAGTGHLVVTIDADFGEVRRGDVAERLVHFTNVGDGPAQVGALTVSAGAFTVDGPSSFEVPAGASRDVAVRFRPTRNGAHTAEVSFTGSSLPASGGFTLRGVGVGPLVRLEPSSIDLGTLPFYEGQVTRAAAVVHVHNDGDRPLVFGMPSASVQPPAELCAGELDALGGCVAASLPPELAPGAERAIPVQVMATTSGLKTWMLTVFTDDPDAPAVMVAIRAELTRRPLCRFSLPNQLGFGVLSPPRALELPVTLLNSGTEPCIVSDLFLGSEHNTPPGGPPVFSLVSPPPLPAQVPPGGQLDVVVRASASGAVAPDGGVVTGSLQLALNAPGAAVVPLDARVESACVLITPEVDFGSVPLNCRSETRTVRVLNTCSQSITLTGTSLPAGPMTFSADVPAPRVLARWATATFTASFRPTSTGAVQLFAGLHYEEAGIATRAWVPLRGLGTTAGVHTERFPPRTQKADVVVVLDVSGSMEPFWPDVQAQLPTLLTALDQSPLDYRLGFLSGATDVLPRLWPTASGARWLTRSTPQRAAQLSTWLQAPRNLESEACLEPLRRAFSAPWNGPTENGLLRDDAMLVVLCVTDNSDWPLSTWEPYFALKPRADQLRVHTITALPGSTGACGDGTLGAPHSDFARLTGGTVGVICQPPWTTLAAVASSGEGQRFTLALPSTPDAQGAAPTVTVRGQPVPPTQGTDVIWSYRQPPPRIDFEPLWAPAPSDDVTVTYPVACAP